MTDEEIARLIKMIQEDMKHLHNQLAVLEHVIQKLQNPPPSSPPASAIRKEKSECSPVQKRRRTQATAKVMSFPMISWNDDSN